MNCVHVQYILIISFMSLHTRFTSALKNNVCKTFEDYHNLDNSKNCSYNPDVFATIEQLAHNHGFELQNFTVKTEDGYFLTIFRIKPDCINCSKIPILLAHGLGASAPMFMTFGDRSLAFYLAKNGYDVWLANFRGTSYGLKHSTFSKSQPQFWDFSFHEMAVYDVPAILEFVHEESKCACKIIFLGLSMGTTVSFIYSSERKEHAEKYVKGIIAISPVASFKYYKGQIEPLSPLLEGVLEGLTSHGFPVFSPEGQKLNEKTIAFCINNWEACITMSNLVFGIGDEEYDPEYLMVSMTHYPDRTSLKSFVHYLQQIQAKKFQQYDYKEKNLEMYNSTVPPIYDLSKVTVPVHLFYGQNDFFCDYGDVKWIFDEIQSPKKWITPIPKNRKVFYNHVNFLNSKNIENYFYRPLMKSLSNL